MELRGTYGGSRACTAFEQGLPLILWQFPQHGQNTGNLPEKALNRTVPTSGLVTCQTIKGPFQAPYFVGVR